MFSTRTPSNGAGILGFALLLGLAIGGWFIGNGITEMRRADRFVTVKGLSEREVVADLAVWQLRTKVAGNDLASTQAQMEANLKAITAFLNTNNFQPNEMESRPIRVVDRRANEYGNGNNNAQRYIVEGGIVVRTARIDHVKKVSQLTNQLVSSGVTLTDDSGCGGGPDYDYTAFNTIKQEMLAEATRNARETATQFAVDSGSRVGQIRRANQGLFSITPRDGGSGCVPSDPHKQIRVVTTVDYYLEK